MRILFEDVHGEPLVTAEYAVHPSLRDRALLYGGHIYEQNRQRENGDWVYRATQLITTSSATHAPELGAFTWPIDRGWDGPGPRIADVPTVPELLARFDHVLSTNAPIPPDAVRDLRDKTYALFKAWGRT